MPDEIEGSSLTERTRDMLELEHALRTALDDGGFELAYQPQFRVDGRLSGVEALIRFRHPTLGVIPPSDFIPLAEKTGLIDPIGEWVLREACKQGAGWHAVGMSDITIGVNVSAVQFGRRDFSALVRDVLAETGFNPELLELELTETAIMDDVAGSAEQMERLKRLGVRIAIDDFGTGYSSLSYLHRLPIDRLKIDRSFIAKMTSASGTLPIVEAILSLCRDLKMGSVAEGVEHQSQFELLTKLGCDCIQGFLLSKPVTASEIAKVPGREPRPSASAISS